MSAHTEIEDLKKNVDEKDNEIEDLKSKHAKELESKENEIKDLEDANEKQLAEITQQKDEEIEQLKL